jgi:hypothetical protein
MKRAMNPFVNPKKRGISLPNGCKDLMDVIGGSHLTADSTLGLLTAHSTSELPRLFIHYVLFKAEQDQATELVIGTSTACGDAPIRYRVETTWYDMAPPFPSALRPFLVAELARMAKQPEGQFPCEGILETTFESGVLDPNLKGVWAVRITSADGECVLTRIPAAS